MDKKSSRMENMEIKNIWENKRVLITGNTGFKGSWLSMMLYSLGADVYGYSLEAPTKPSIYELCKLQNITKTKIADIRDLDSLKLFMKEAQPEVVFHLAAQPIVRESYKNPIETYQTNVMGTANILEAVRFCDSVRAVVMVTSDKCYENKEWLWSYRENDVLGGYDPYSNSKACSELVISSYRNSFFNVNKYNEHKVAIASVRAGNVIGGGDFALDRLIPDIIKAFLNNEKVIIRSPYAIRPWQYVLDALYGYILVAEKLYIDGEKFSEAFNFSSDEKDNRNVEWIVKEILKKWDNKINYEIQNKNNQPHEAKNLTLDSSKARFLLNWKNKYSLEETIENIIKWTIAYRDEKNILEFSMKQIKEYLEK